MDFVETIKAAIPYDHFTESELANILSGTDNRRHQLVKRAMAKGRLQRIRRGLYCLSESDRRDPVNLFALAQRIYGPSCISLESALSYHGWIPEAVYTTTSVAAKRSSEFKTPLGVFAYHKVPIETLFTAVDLVSSGPDAYFMARPWKALADYLFIYKKNFLGLEPLRKALRIEAETLRNYDVQELHEIDQAYRNLRVSRFISSILQELAGKEWNKQ